jgi:hypothetical protein
MKFEQAKQASDILQKINSANEIISLLKLNDIGSISFNKISGNVFIGEQRLVDDLIEYSIDILREEVSILTKKLENL